LTAILKTLHQSIVAPAVVHLTEKLGTNYPFKDAGRWTVTIKLYQDENLVVVTHSKREQTTGSTNFLFCWNLDLHFDWNLTQLVDVKLRIPAEDIDLLGVGEKDTIETLLKSCELS